MNWIIRSPVKADLEELADIYLAVRRDTFTWVNPLTFRHEDFFAHTQGEMVWLAEADDGEIAGFMTLWSPDDFVHMLYLRKQYQGMGIGTALLRALPDWPDRKYRLKCLDRNERAKAFYRAHGFVVTGAGASGEGDYEEMTFFPAS
jgi:GNAT superfamily N-acetyltransferase